MFRINSIVRSCNLKRGVSYGRYSTLNEKPKGKVFIIDVKDASKCNDVLANKISAQTTLRKIEQKEFREDQWKRLMGLLNEIFDKYKAQGLEKAKELKIDEIILKLKKEIEPQKLKEKFNDSKLKELVSSGQLEKFASSTVESWKVIKTSEGYAKVLSFPSTAKKMFNNAALKAQEHLVVLNESPYKQKILHVVTIVLENAKKGSIELFKFIKDVYNAPSQPPKK